MGGIPIVATHYFCANRRPFQNLSELSGASLADVLAGLEADRRAGQHRRPFGPRYMALRHATERRLRDLFIAAGGLPDRMCPHYFVLGESAWYAALADDMCSVQIPLVDLPESKTSVTWCDSFTAMGAGTSFGVDRDPRPYHDRVYGLMDIGELVARYGIHSPAPSSGDWRSWPQDTFVEIQLWSDDPVSAYLE